MPEKLSDHLVEDAKRAAAAEQNPDLSLQLVRELLRAKSEEASGEYLLKKSLSEG